MNESNLQDLNNEIINQRNVSQINDSDILKLKELIEIELQKLNSIDESISPEQINRIINYRLILNEANQIMQDAQYTNFIDNANKIDSFKDFANYLKFAQTQQSSTQNLDADKLKEYQQKFIQIINSYNGKDEDFNFQINQDIDDIKLPKLETLQNVIPPEYLQHIITNFCTQNDFTQLVEDFLSNLISAAENQNDIENKETNIQNLSSFILYADELFLRKYLEENLEKLIKLTQNPDLDDTAFAKIVALIDIEKDSKNLDGKYDEIFKQLDKRFGLVIDGINTQKKLAALKNEYYTTTDEKRKQEIAQTIGEIETQRENFKILSIKNPELIAKMLINIEKDKMLSTLKGMKSTDMLLFLNALGEKNISSLNNLLNKVKEIDASLEKNARLNLNDKNLKDITEHKKQIGETEKQDKNIERSLKNDSKNANKDTQSQAKQNVNNLQDKSRDKDDNIHNINETKAWKIMNSYSASRRQEAINQIKISGNDKNLNILKNQMSVEQMREQGLLKGSIAEQIQKLQSQGIKIDGKTINQIINSAVNDANNNQQNIKQNTQNLQMQKNTESTNYNAKNAEKPKVDTFLDHAASQKAMNEYIATKQIEKEKEKEMEKIREKQHQEKLNDNENEVEVTKKEERKQETHQLTTLEKGIIDVTKQLAKQFGVAIKSIASDVKGMFDEMIKHLTDNGVEQEQAISISQKHIISLSQQEFESPEETIEKFKQMLTNQNQSVQSHHFRDIVKNQSQQKDDIRIMGH